MSMPSAQADQQLNWEVIEAYVVQACGGDLEVVLQMIEFFLKSGTTLVQEMKEGVDRGDFDSVRRAAHSLKSSSRMFSAELLAEYCLAVEETARAAQSEEIDEQLAGIQAQLGWLQEALPALCKEKMNAEGK